MLPGELNTVNLSEATSDVKNICVRNDTNSALIGSRIVNSRVERHLQQGDCSQNRRPRRRATGLHIQQPHTILLASLSQTLKLGKL